VTNVRRHADAKNLWVTVTVEPPNAHISVVDDGRGLGKGRLDSFGIQGMRERAARIGALLTVQAGVHGGTVVEIGLGTVSRTAAPPIDLPAVSRASLTDPRGVPMVVPPAPTEPAQPVVGEAADLHDVQLDVQRHSKRVDQEVT
jgi:hypothetical protein